MEGRKKRERETAMASHPISRFNTIHEHLHEQEGECSWRSLSQISNSNILPRISKLTLGHLSLLFIREEGKHRAQELEALRKE